MTKLHASSLELNDLPPHLAASHSAMLTQIADHSLAPGTTRRHRGTWGRFERFAVASRRPAESPDEGAVLAFLSALRDGTAPGSSKRSGAASLRHARDGIRYVCLVNRWPDPTHSPAISAMLTGAARADAGERRRGSRPLDASTVRRIMDARPEPDPVTLRGRIALAVHRTPSITTGQLVRLHREQIGIDTDRAVLQTHDRTGGPVVLWRNPDPDVCPVRALELLLRRFPMAAFPLSVTRRAGGEFQTADAGTLAETERASRPTYSQIKNALNSAGVPDARERHVASISVEQYEVAAWRMDPMLSTALRNEASLLLAWHAGMRRIGLVELRLDVDVVINDESIQVHRRGRDGTTWTQEIAKARDPRLCSVRALQRWRRLAALTSGDFIFCPIIGKGWPDRSRPLTEEGWSRAWQGLGDRAGVDSARLWAISPRRGFVEITSEQGASLPQIAAAVGPESAEAVARQRRQPRGRNAVARRVGL